MESDKAAKLEEIASKLRKARVLVTNAVSALEDAGLEEWREEVDGAWDILFRVGNEIRVTLELASGEQFEVYRRDSGNTVYGPASEERCQQAISDSPMPHEAYGIRKLDK